MQARSRGHCRGKPVRAQQRSIWRVRTRFGKGEGQLDRRRARGVLNPCARESKARAGRFWRGKLVGHGLFSSYEGKSRSGERTHLWVVRERLYPRKDDIPRERMCAWLT